MRQFLIINQTRPLSNSIALSLCDTFWSRFRGLMLRPSLHPGEGIILAENSQSVLNATIHMLFMRFDIGLVWLNREHQVVDRKIARQWQLAVAPQAPAAYILEIHPTQLEQFQVGDYVEFQPQ